MALCLMLALGFVTRAHGNTNVRFVEARSGGELSFNCSTTLLQDGLTVYWSLPEPQEVLFLNRHPRQLTIRTPFKGRATAAGNIAMLSVTISKLTVNNSGLYWCKYDKYNKVNITVDVTRGDGPVTMLHLTGGEAGDDSMEAGDDSMEAGDDITRGDDRMIWAIVGLGTSSALLFCVLLICVKVKTFQERKGQIRPPSDHGIYEDMRHPLPKSQP